MHVIFAGFKGSENKSLLRESLTHLYNTFGNILISFKFLKGMSPPGNILSSNVEISSSRYSGVTG